MPPDRWPNVAIRDGRRKLLVNADHVGLYDLSRNAGEANNIAAARRQIVARLKGRVRVPFGTGEADCSMDHQ
jgi:hypothetical protein